MRALSDLPRDQVDVQELLQRLDALKAKRTTFDTHWEEIALRIWPAAADFITKREPGEKRTWRMVDTTAANALERFAAILESLLTPRHQMWHRLRASDPKLNEDPSVKAWFEQANKTLNDTRKSPRANYHSQKHEGYKSLGAFGTEGMFIDEAPTGRGVRYQNCYLGQLYIDVAPGGMVDTVFRLFPMTAKAIYQKWGDKAPPKIKESVRERPFEFHDILHAVFPRKLIDPERFGPESMPWQSHYVGVDEKVVIESGGYQEMPYTVGRYTVNPTEVYGRSPAMLALPTVHLLNEMKRSVIRQAHRAIEPPLLLHDDGVMGAGARQVRLAPNGLNYGGVNSQGQALIQPLVTGSRLEITREMIGDERDAVNEFFLVSLFRILLDDPRIRTATEVLERAKEKAQVLAPTIGRQQSETLGPQLERELAIHMRQGLLPPLPPALIEAEGEYEIEYVSEATQMQRAGELVGIRNTIDLLTPFVAAGNPGALDVFDSDEVARVSAEIENVPSKVLRTPDQLEALRQERAQQMQQQQQLAAAEQAAGAAKDGTAAIAQLGGLSAGAA